jgi:hypothetical protein
MPRWAKRLLRILGWTYISYLAISLLIVLPAINIAAPWAVREFLGRELRHEIIIFNPFTLTVELRGVSLHERDGHEPVAVKKALASLAVSSLWRPGIVLDRIRVEELMIHVLRYADGSFHFDDLLATDAKESTADDSGALPGISIDSLYLGARELRFTDRTHPDTYTAAYRDFAVETQGISTLPERRGDGDLRLLGADGGEIRWTGEVAIAEGRSSGEVSVSHLGLTHVWRYLSEELPFVTESALIDLQLRYDVSWVDQLSFAVNDGSFRLHNLMVTPDDPQRLPNTSIVIGDLALDDIDVESGTQRVSLAAVNLRGAALRGFSEGTRVSLLEMLVDGSASNGVVSAAGDEVPAPGDAEADAGGGDTWQIEVASVTVDDSVVEWRSEELAPERIAVTPIAFQARELSWPARDSSPFDLALTVNDDMQITVDGVLHLGDGDGSLRYNLDRLPLPWGNPVLQRYVRADVTGGLLSIDGEVSLTSFAPATILANLDIAGFASQIHGAEESAASFDNFTVTGARVDMDTSAVDIDDVLLRSPRGALHILKDGSFNANSALVDSGDDSGTDSAGGGQEPLAQVPGEGASETAAEDAGSSADWAVRVTHIGVRSGQLDFSDDSLPLPFRTLIGDIEADITDVDSRSEQPLTATLNGSVDGYAPVVIEARGRPLAEPRDASLTLQFRGMDIATMSPYSGTYAGYTIDSGTLSVDLRYGVQGSELDGDNRIVISQMELGEPIDSDLAMQLPLKLGIALLTDASGVIDLDVPISGDVDDPQFAIGRVIGGAIANVIVKAATAPFQLLAGLVNSEEDLENIAFAAGTAELGDGGRSALGSLAEALGQRPKLQLRVVGSADPAADRRALQAQALEQALLAAGITSEQIAARSEVYVAAIDTRYAALGLPAPEDGSEVALEAKLDTLVSRVELPSGALQDLGITRATAAKRELVTGGGIDAGRIAVSYDSGLLMSGIKMSLDG